ncbi:MAG: DUF4918 family protein [Cyclobacteriaceae bacterium]|nr:DUF4918 family protein [Cyclobacteriaceae bacterium]
MLFSDAVLQYYSELSPPANLPDDVEVMNPFQNPDTMALTTAFYQKYYADQQPRYLCFGINPGRFGAGLTGVPFTDPLRLQEDCGIENILEKKPELSSRFIYEMIHAYGGPDHFYQRFFISAVSPLGYLRQGINLNYYDIKGYKAMLEPYVVRQIRLQLKFGIRQEVAFSIGKGENVKYLNYLNQKHRFFGQIVPLSHPRWVMQYRLRRKSEFISEYLDAFASLPH